MNFQVFLGLIYVSLIPRALLWCDSVPLFPGLLPGSLKTSSKNSKILPWTLNFTMIFALFFFALLGQLFYYFSQIFLFTTLFYPITLPLSPAVLFLSHLPLFLLHLMLLSGNKSTPSLVFIYHWVLVSGVALFLALGSFSHPYYIPSLQGGLFSLGFLHFTSTFASLVFLWISFSSKVVPFLLFFLPRLLRAQ